MDFHFFSNFSSSTVFEGFCWCAKDTVKLMVSAAIGAQEAPLPTDFLRVDSWLGQQKKGFVIPLKNGKLIKRRLSFHKLDRSSDQIESE